MYRTFDTRLDAERSGVQALVQLARHDVPVWLQHADSRPLKTIGEPIRAYSLASAVPASTERLLETLEGDLGAHKLDEVTYAWGQDWIRGMKLEHHSAPGTIRKKKGALSRVLHWVTMTHPMCLSMNPLALLPKRYSGYDRNSRDVLKAQGIGVPVDVERNRRIDRDEEAQIVAFLERKLSAATTDDERAEVEGMILMFQLGLETCMRMREL